MYKIRLGWYDWTWSKGEELICFCKQEPVKGRRFKPYIQLPLTKIELDFGVVEYFVQGFPVDGQYIGTYFHSTEGVFDYEVLEELGESGTPPNVVDLNHFRLNKRSQ